MGRGIGFGFELPGEGAHFVGDVGDETAMGIAAFQRVERANGFGDVGGEGVGAELQLDQIGRRPDGGRRRPRPAAQGLNGGANPAGIGGGEGEFLAIDLDGFAVDVGGNLAIGAGRDTGDFGEAEVGVAELGVLADEAIGVRTADAGILFAEFLPGEAEVIEHLGIANLFEALSAGGGAIAGEDGEGLLEADPGTEIDVFLRVHGAFSSRTLRNSGYGLLGLKTLERSLRFVQNELVRSSLERGRPAGLFRVAGSFSRPHCLSGVPAGRGAEEGGIGGKWRGFIGKGKVDWACD